MAVATATYKVGDTFTTQKSKVTGTIEEIIPQANGNVRVKLMVEGKPRYTTWTAKQSNPTKQVQFARVLAQCRK